MLLPWMSRSGPWLALRRATDSALRTIDGEDVALHVRPTGGRGWCHQVEGRAVGIGHHGDAPDAANLLARHQRPPTALLDPGDRRIDIGDAEVAEPAWPCTMPLHLLG